MTQIDANVYYLYSGNNLFVEDENCGKGLIDNLINLSSDKARLDHIDRNISFIKLNNWNEVAAVLLTFVEEKERIFVLEKLKKHEKLKTMNLDTRVVWNCFLEKDSIETVKKILFANIPNTDSDTDSEIEYDSDS